MNEPAKEFTSVHKKTLLVTLIAMLVIGHQYVCPQSHMEAY